MLKLSHVTLEQACCPACARTFDTGALLLDRRLQPRFEHHTVTHFALCPEDQQKVDEGYVILVAIDPAKSGDFSPAQAHRTGEMAYLRRNIADALLPASIGHDMVWVEPGVIRSLQNA